MLAGLKDRDKGPFNYQPTWRSQDKKNGITLVEVLVAAFILAIIMSALFLVLNVGEFSNTIAGAKLEVQQEVRRTMDWMVKDLRQTDRMRLLVRDVSGDPLTQNQFNSFGNDVIITYPLFNICIGYSVSGNLWSSNQIGYTYDAVNQRIVRSDSGTGNTWQFNHINSLTFTKTGLNSLLIEIVGQRTAIGTIAPTFTLQEEVKLRNE
jgi:prepilin-type N-terminal cleavage/methylation domain-containing protein